MFVRANLEEGKVNNAKSLFWVKSRSGLFELKET